MCSDTAAEDQVCRRHRSAMRRLTYRVKVRYGRAARGFSDRNRYVEASTRPQQASSDISHARVTPFGEHNLHLR